MVPEVIGFQGASTSKDHEVLLVQEFKVYLALPSWPRMRVLSGDHHGWDHSRPLHSEGGSRGKGRYAVSTIGRVHSGRGSVNTQGGKPQLRVTRDWERGQVWCA